MKKTLILFLCAVLALGLTGCGESAPELSPTADEAQETLAPVVPTAEEIMEASASEAESIAKEMPASASDAEAPASETAASASDAELDEEAFAAAEACVGLSLEELYAAVGEPTGDVSYAASCLEENAEDGMLFYDELGFYVWTVRNADGETVHAVYPLD